MAATRTICKTNFGKGKLILNLLEVKNLSKTYATNRFASLTDINLDLPNPQIFGLAGSSGSGKSTLLRLIAGLEEPDNGTILLEGNQVLPPSQKLIAGHEHICLLNQDSQLRANLTIKENLEYGLRKYNPEYKTKRINTLLELCQLQNHAHKTATQISGGEQQRAAWALALATKPKVLLLDEPFSHADPSLCRQLRNILTDIINQDSCLIIVASHEPDNLFAVCEQIMMLENGQNIQTDTPFRIFNHPAHAQIASWASPISLLTSFQMLDLGFENLENNRIYGLRACFVLVSEFDSNKALPFGIVIKSEFQGRYYLLHICISENQKNFVYGHSHTFYPKGTQVQLSVLADKVMDWAAK